jgi:hypothetical protein
VSSSRVEVFEITPKFSYFLGREGPRSRNWGKIFKGEDLFDDSREIAI